MSPNLENHFSITSEKLMIIIVAAASVVIIYFICVAV